MKNRAFVIGLLSLLAVSCSLNEISPLGNDLSVSGGEFYVTIDEQPVADTKVYADENLKVLWNADDRMSIFNKNTFNQEYKFLGDEGDNAGAIVRVDDTAGSGDPLEHIYAVYPYVESTAIDASGTLSFTLPGEQSYHEKSFGIGANTMVSVTDDIRLKFKNVGGYLSLKFYGEGVSVSSIVLKGNNGELLSGPCSISTSSGIPAVTMSSGASDQVTLVCDPPVVLGSTSSEAVQFIFVLPPVTLTEGFTVTVTTPEGAVFEKSSSNNYEIGRSAITKMGAMKVLPELPGNIVFADQTVKSICVKYWDENNDGGLSYEEAAAVESLMVDAALTKAGEEVSAFAGTGITTFDELVYFTGLLEIEDGAFENCKGLKSVTISEQVGKIGDNAFNGCQNLESITLTSPTPPEIGANVFDNTNDCPIYVPEEAIEAYQSEWSEHLDYVGRIVGAILPDNFPDENFRAYVFKNFDTNKDGVLSEEECDAVKWIEVNTDDIYSMEGIRYFQNLVFLRCSGSFLDGNPIGQLTSLDVSNNQALRNLLCEYNQITSLDVRNNTALTQLDFQFNQISTLDLSKNGSLISLRCEFNHLSNLDLRNNPALLVLSCNSNQITDLDVSNNSALNNLDCGSNLLTTLDVSNNASLRRLGCEFNQLTSLDVSNNANLKTLVCFSNNISSLDVSYNTQLEFLNCDSNQLPILDVSNNMALQTLLCVNSTMQYLYLADGQEISRISKDDNTIIVYKGTELTTNKIYYTSVDGSVITPNASATFGANIISNDYIDGQGIITFDADVTEIGKYAFQMYPSELTGITIPSSVTKIGEGAFWGCMSLTDIVIPNSVISIENYAFEACYSLSSISVEDGNEYYDSRDNCNAVIKTSTNELIAGCKNTIIPETVTSIGWAAFSQCANLTSITIPNSVITIKNRAFADSGLQSIIIPASVQSISNSAFNSTDLGSIIVEAGNSVYDSRENCNAIIKTSTNELIAGCRNTIIPETVISIGRSAFNGCGLLGGEGLFIPKNVTSIGDMAFNYFTGEIIMVSQIPPTIGQSVFSPSSILIIYVPAENVETYKTDTAWSEYSEYIQPFVSIPDVVDLGLSVKWASFNIGAASPEEYGDYYAWGERRPYYSSLEPLYWFDGKEGGYAWGSYRFNPDGDGSTFTKYIGSDYSTLQDSDDAARVNLGGGWRMPTIDEWLELRNTSNCEWSWAANYEGSGHNGYIVTSKKDGYTDKSIFLPAAGNWNEDAISGAGEIGEYWSSTLKTDTQGFSYAYSPYFWEGNVNWSGSRRSEGRQIRPVYVE